MANGMSVFSHNGVDYIINDPNIAPEFSASASYSKGDYVTYNGNLYRFTTAHSGAWNASDAAVVTVAEAMNQIIADVASDIAGVESEITDTNDEIGDCYNAMPPTQKTLRTIAGTNIMLDDPGITGLKMTTTKAVIYPVNLWEYYADANIMSSYNSHYTVESKNNGVEITRDEYNTGDRFTRYKVTVPISGYVYLSCDAHTTHPTMPCRIAIAPASDQNNDLALPSRGLNHLMVGAYVNAGDTIVVKLYAGAADAYENTWTYENIMLSYSMFSDFALHEQIRSNYEKSVVVGNYTSENHSASPGHGYFITYDTNIASPYLPDDNSKVPSDLFLSTNFSGLKLVSYNDVFASNENNLIGINTSGDVAIYMDGSDRTVVDAWVKENDISFRYIPSSGNYTGIPFGFKFATGNVIKYNSASTISYYTSSGTKRKIMCFGDSITGMFDNGGGYVGMLNYMNRDAEFINCGFSGCRWTDHNTSMYMPFSMNRLADAIATQTYTLQNASDKVNPQSENYDKLYADHLNNIKNTDFNQVDFVTIFYGVNDYASGAYLDSDSDPATENKQRSNVEDAVAYTIRTLLTAYPKLTILLVCPYWSYITGSDSDTTPNSIGVYLYQYADMIAETGAKYNMGAVNLYRKIGVNGMNRTCFLTDSAHPNYRLSKMIANKINNEIGDYN